MFKNLRKLFLISFLVVFLILPFANFVLAQARELEVRYPGEEAPRTTKTYLPDYIMYIFKWGLIISGLVVFGILIFGGVLYLTSAGDPGKMGDARNWMFSAITGMIILFGAYIILNTINPQLTVLKPTIEEYPSGVILYKIVDCGSPHSCGGDYKCLKKLGLAEKYLSSINNITSFSGPQKDQVKSIKFLSSSDMLTVKIYPNINYDGNPKIYSQFENPFTEGECRSFSDWAGSLSIDYLIPGVYLFAEKDYKGEQRIYTTSGYPSLGAFDNKAKSLKIVDKKEGGVTTLYYGAILHKEPKFEDECSIFFTREDPEFLSEVTDLKDKRVGYSTSSVTVFHPRIITEQEEEETKVPCGSKECIVPVTIYENEYYNFGGTKGDKLDIAIGVDQINHETPQVFVISSNLSHWIDGDKYNNWITSLKIAEGFTVVLFDAADYKGKCGVFYPPGDPNLRNNPMGMCWKLDIPPRLDDCASGIIVIPIERFGGAEGVGPPFPPTCTNECTPPGDKEMCAMDCDCRAPGSGETPAYACTCEDHDGDGCYEWGGAFLCTVCSIEPDGTAKCRTRGPCLF